MTEPNSFINIDRALWRRADVANLSPMAKLLLVELHYRHNGRNNGAIRLSWGEAQALLKCSRRTVARTFAKLRQAGLIETTVSGTFDDKTGASKGTCNQYRLTHLR